jgi:glycosyltransferase involved in cell wall biosynthesis
MRIAFVIPGSGGGGVRSVVRIAAGLIGHGCSVRILYRHQPPDLRDRVRQMYLAVRYRRGHAWLRSFPGEALPYESLTPKLVGSNDLIVGVGVSCVLAIADLPPHCGIKVHNSRGVEPWRSDDMTRAWAIPMPRIVVASHLVPLMREAGSIDPIFVAPNGVDRADYFPSLPETARDGVGAVYHGGDVKDPGLILETLNRLADRRPSLPLYVFSTFPRPRRLPRNATFVRFPSLAAARELYSRSLVWFLASRNEGLPNPLLEGLACGCALVSTDCGGAYDIIEHNRTGLIVPVGDADAMVQSILRLLEDAALRKRFVAASSETLENFTWPRAIDAFEHAITAITEGTTARSPRPEHHVTSL